MPQLGLADVPGLRVGHATLAEARTGCTVILASEGAVAGVDVRGSAPGTRETDLLRPTALVERVHAICLAGGSAFGLAAADGVMRWLAERGIGHATGVRPVPIVPAAIIFDLTDGAPPLAPGPDDGYAACDAAERGDQPLEGRVGAGAGASVAKLAGPGSGVPAGVGMAARHLAGGRIVGALAVVNALGRIRSRDGRELTPGPPWAGEAQPFGNSTLVVIGTDAALDRAACRKLAELGHDALARSIHPVHTMFDGDVVFVLSTGDGPRPDAMAFTALAVAAEDAVSESVERAVLLARPQARS